MLRVVADEHRIRNLGIGKLEYNSSTSIDAFGKIKTSCALSLVGSDV